MLSVRLDSTVPLTEQIVIGLRGAIARGEVHRGDRLPSVRQLAGDLGINLNTVSRAYRVLEESGLVSTRRGRGTQITAERDDAAALDPERLRERTRALLADLRLADLSRAEVDALLRDELDRLYPEDTP